MKRAIAIVTVAFVMLVCATREVWSWGKDGHRTVGMIADILLEQRPASRDRVKQILGDNSLSEVSLWADCAKGYRVCQRPASDEEKAFTRENRRHHAFHYTDVPIAQSQYRAETAGTGRDDVVQVMQHAIKVLQGKTPKDGPAVLNQREALWLLVHLVGDIHQPLHIGAIYFDGQCAEAVDPNVAGAGQPDFGIGTTVVSTAGGNDLKISKSKSLHSYWDSDTVKGAMRLLDIRNKSIEDFARAIISSRPTAWKMTGNPDTWPTQWATEAMPLAKAALTRVHIGEGAPANGGHGKCTWPIAIDRAYTQWANQQALAQLGKAGFRLAELLQAIFEGEAEEPAYTGSVPRR